MISLTEKNEKEINDDRDYYNYSRVVVVVNNNNNNKPDFFLDAEDLSFLLDSCDSLSEQVERINLLTQVILDKDCKKIMLILKTLPIAFFNQLQETAKISIIPLRTRLSKLVEIGIVKHADKALYKNEIEGVTEYMKNRHYGQFGEYGYVLTPFGIRFVDQKMNLLQSEIDISFIKRLLNTGEGIQKAIIKLAEEKRKSQEEEVKKFKTLFEVGPEVVKNTVKCCLCGIMSTPEKLKVFDKETGIYYCHNHDIRDIYPKYKKVMQERENDVQHSRA